MGRDIFDKRIGEALRGAEASVPQGAWEAIQRELAYAPSSSGMGFSAGVVAGLVMLASLAAYSTFREVETPLTPSVETVDSAIAESEMAPEEQDEMTNSESPTMSPSPAEKSGINNEKTEISIEVSATDAPHINPMNTDAPTPPLVPVPMDKNQLATLPEPPAHPRGELITPEEVSTEDESSSSAEVSENPVLRAAIQAANRSGYAPFEIDFVARGNFEEVEWDFGPYGKSTEATTRVTFDEPGLYTVSLFGFAHGDMVTDLVTIEVHEGSNLLVPDSFTPNGDGINDTYKAEGVNLESYRMTIVDTRGKVVFETRNMEEPWVYQGPPVGEMDAHFVIIQARGIDGKEYNIRKRINIIF